MSMSGSVMTFDNNNGCELGSKSKKHPTIQPKQSQPQHSGQSQQQNTAHAHDKHRHSKSSSSSSSSSSCFRAHLNSLWSVWYGLCTAGLQAYMAEQSARRFLGYASLPWPGDSPPPRLELHAHLALTGLAALMIPFFLAAAIFKVGNLANDGFKLGRHLGTCSVDPASSVALGRSGVLRSLWQHGGPTAPFLHLATAFCLLLPKLLMEARLIQAGFLPKDAIWRTDLDFMVVHRDRLVVLSFMTSPTGSTTNYSSLPTPLPFYTATPNASAATSNISTTTPSLSTVRSLPFRTLQDLMSGIEPGLESGEGDDDDWLGPISPEFLNYALALLVYAVRYPAVFWATNKGFGALFSMQLLANGLQSLLAYAGVCVLYKVQVLGAAEALPLYRGGAPEILPTGSPFLLNTHVTLALFILSNVLILASSLVLYLYGYGRFNAFLSSERERRVIVLQRWAGGGIGTSGGGWGYFTHCAALCVLMALAVCQAPLLYDYTVVYRGSLDGAILATAVGAIVHLFLWIVLWLFLTVKQRWVFKLRVTVGRAAVRSARSIKLVTDVDLVSGRHSSGGHDSAPLLVVGNGRTYTIADTSPKKAIMSVIQKAALDRKAKASQGNTSGGSAMDDGEEQIYWLRPKPPSPKTSPDSSDRLAWLNRKLGGSGGSKHKVTFDDSLSSTNSRKGKSLLAKSPKNGSGGKTKGKSHQQAVTAGKRGAVGLDQLTESEEDDGDYATLREIPLLPNDDNDTLSEDNKLLDSALQDDNVTYARTNRDLTPGDYEDPSPLITPEPSRDLDEDLDLPPPPTDPNTPTNSNATSTAATVTVHNNNNDAQQQPQQQQQQPQQATPRCLRRADSGMPHDELTPRSDSVSTESSGSGGSPPSSTGNHSETSSGVHSNSSGSDKQTPAVQNQPPNNPRGRSTSVDDLSGQPIATQNWRSFSLQRNVQPPTSATMANISPPPPVYGFHPDAPTNATVITAPGGVPAVLLESSTESTVVIRRKASRPKTTDGEVATDPPILKDEPFSRSTNMRMTSFTDNPDHNATATPIYPSSSATLPHYPTQPHVAVAAVYPHCSTMPLPSSAAASSSSNGGTPTQVGNGGSCHSFPRHHTTIPTHHNGVRLFAGPNPFVKRFPPFHHQGNGLGPVVAGRVVVAAPVVYGNSSGNTLDGGHHTFPSQVVKYSTPQHCRPQDRDSANFSMASSGDSDQYLPHHA